jgi:hypothetical protein
MRQIKCQYNYALFKATKQKVKCLSLNEQPAGPPPTVVYVQQRFAQLIRGPLPLRGLISAGAQIPVSITTQFDQKFGQVSRNPTAVSIPEPEKKLRNELFLKAEADSELSGSVHLTST